jgi:aminoglycoside phosphotransferase (APT) family kinase protein
MSSGEESARSELGEEWQRAFGWIERNLGGKIIRYERQPRWRPACFLDLEKDGQILPLYFRGDRGETDHGVYPLEHEMRVLQVLEAHGILVPHVYGFCEDPRGIVMERSPGRANLATIDDDAEREAVLDHYIELLAKMHQIDVAAFEAIGLERPQTAEQLGLGDFDAWERTYRQRKSRPEPLIEFLIRWLRRNPPRNRSRATFLAGDSGQFLFEHGRVTAILDLELAYLGDPAADLGGLRSRDLSEPLGDLPRAIRKYAEITGEEVDLRVIDYHTVRFMICTPMAVAHVVAKPPLGTEFVQYLAWYLVYSRAPIEVLAHRIGVGLEPVEIPDPKPTRHSPAHAALVARLQREASGDGFGAYRLDAPFRMAQYLERADQLGPALEVQDLDEVAQLVSFRPASWAEADAELERLVQEAGPERDAEFVRYFHRRMLRQEAILKPAMRELENSVVQRLDER